jgi:hypothetical protein
MHDQLTNNARALATLAKAESLFVVEALLFGTELRHNCTLPG